MDWERLIAPTGTASFVLFLFALLNGIPRFRLLRFHAATGYACCAAVLVHGAVSVQCHIIEPLGILAAFGMVLTAVSGRAGWKLRLHVLIALATLLLSLMHVALVWYLAR